MPDNSLKIKVLATLNTGLSIGEINRSLKSIEKKVNALKLNVQINDNVLNTLKNFTKELNKIGDVAKNQGKVIEEYLSPSGEKIKRTYFNGLKGEFSEITQAAKDSAKQQMASIDEVTQGYAKLTREVTRLNAAQKEVGKTTTVSDKNGINTRRVTSNANGEVTSITDTTNLAREEKLTNQLTDSKERLRQKLLQLNNAGQVTNSSLARMNTVINGASDINELNKIQQAITRIDDSTRAREKTRELEKQLELYRRQAQVNVNNITRRYGDNVNTNELNSYLQAVNSLNTATPNLNHQMQDLGMRFREISSNVRTSQSHVLSFGQAMRTALSRFPVWMAAATAFYFPLRQFEQGLKMVKDLDDAMTNLKKVTNETNDTYQKFVKSAFQVSDSIGATATSIIQSTTEFARLGYTMQQAQELAKQAQVYANVGDMNIDDASQSLISTMKAYNIEADKQGKNLEKVVDLYNNIGNKFAISSSGIGEAMRRSASSLKEAGNTIEESVALITAANSTIQDPASVGTALKTVSMRLRGLTEDGEAIDGLAPKLEKAFNRVGLSLKKNDNTFKSTYEIMKDLSTVWSQLTDFQKSDILEQVAGKRQGNIVASLLSNFDEAIRSQKEGLNSAGSSAQELNTYLDSVDAKLNKFKNQGLEFWQKSLDTDGMKAFIGLGTDFISLLTKITSTMGFVTPALGALTVGLLLFNNTLKTKTMASGIAFTSWLKTLPALFTTVNSSIDASTARTRVWAATVNTAKFYWGGFTKILKSTGTFLAGAFLPTLGIMAFATVISFVTKKIMEHNEAVAKAKKQLNDEVKALKDNKQQISSLVDEYDALSKAKDRQHGKLDNAQEEKYVELQNELGRLLPNVVKSTDAKGNSILQNTKNIREQITVLQKLIDLENDKKRQDAPDIIKKNVGDINKDWAGFDVGHHKQADLDTAKQLAKFYEKQAKDAASAGKSRNTVLKLEQLATEQKMKQFSLDLEIGNIRAKNASAIKTILGDTKLNSKLKDDVSDLVSKLSFKGKNSGEIETIILSLGKAVESYNKALNDGNKDEVKTAKKNLQGLVKEYGEGKLTVDKFVKAIKSVNDNDDNGSKKAKADTQNKLNELEKQSTEDIIQNTIAQNKNTHSVQENTASKDDNASAMEKLLGYRQSDIDGTKDNIAIYELLSGQEKLSVEQKQQLADATTALVSQYPNLVKNGKLQVDQLLKENEAKEILLQATNKLKDGSLTTEQIKTVTQATQTKLRIEAMQKELIALDTIREAYQDTIDTYYGNNQVSEAETAQMALSAALYNESDKAKKDYAEKKKKLDELSSSMDGYNRKLADVVNYNGQYYKSTENASKATQSSIYISDKYKKKLDEVSLAIAKQQALQNKYPNYSSQYQSALKKEISLLNDKKKIMEEQTKELQKQIKSGNIKPTGMVTTSSSTTTSGGGYSGKYASEINAAALKYGVDPNLIAAIIKNESGFNQSARSGAGAIGLMQLMPSTAKGLGVNPYNATDNIMGGAKYIAQQLKTFGGDLNKALAAYNAGAGNVRKYGGIPPFAETQAYVKKVMASYNSYGGGSTSTTSKSKADKAQALDEAKSNLVQMQQDIIDVNNQIAQLQTDLINSIVQQYDKSAAKIESQIQKYATKQENTDPYSSQYRKEINNQMNLINKENRLKQREIDMWEKELTSNKNLNAVQRQTIQDRIDALKENVAQLKKENSDKAMEMIDSKLNSYDNIRQQNDYASSKYKFREQYADPTSDTYRQAIQNQLILQSNSRKMYEEELAYIDQELKANKYLNDAQKKALQDRYAQAKDALLTLNYSVVDLQNKIFQSQMDASQKQLDTLTSQMEASMKTMEKYYDDQIAAQQTQLDLLDDQIEKEDRLQKLQDINDQIDKAKADKRYEYINAQGQVELTYDKAKVSDLEKQRDDMVKQYERDDMKKAIQDEIDRLQKAKSDKLAIMQQELDDLKTNYAKKIEEAQKYWNDMLLSGKSGTFDFSKMMSGFFDTQLQNITGFGTDLASQIDIIKALYASLTSLNLSSPVAWSSATPPSSFSSDSAERQWRRDNPYSEYTLDVENRFLERMKSQGSMTAAEKAQYDELVKKHANLPKFHEGGVVGDKPPSKLAQIANKLFNVKPSEQLIKSLVGELYVPPQNIANGINNIKNMMSMIKPFNAIPIINQKHYHLKDITVQTNDITKLFNSIDYLIQSEQ